MSTSVAAALSTVVSSGTRDRAVRGRWDRADLAALRASSLGSLDDPLSNACTNSKGVRDVIGHCKTRYQRMTDPGNLHVLKCR
jgi:hypothetical protein